MPESVNGDLERDFKGAGSAALASSPASVAEPVRAATPPRPDSGVADLLAAELAKRPLVSLIYSDLDNFKSVNDRLGHEAGDRCVANFERIAAEILEGRGQLRRRYATGDEFVSILPNFTVPEAVAVAERIRRSVESASLGGDVPVTASLGVYSSELAPDAAADELLRRADEMMYRAKQTKNAVAFPEAVSGSPGAAQLAAELEKWARNSERRWEAVVQDRVSGESRQFYYASGAWSFAYAVSTGNVRLSLAELFESLRKMPSRPRCMRPWRVPLGQDYRPYPFEGALECWPTSSPDGYSPEFWRASPELRLFYLRKYQEDEIPGTGQSLLASGKLVAVAPVWRIAECILHAARLSRALLLPPGPVAFRSRWTGLRGRRMARAWDASPDVKHECRQDVVESVAAAPASDLEIKLAEITAQLVAPLYEAFSLFLLDEQSLRQEISLLLSDCASSR